MKILPQSERVRIIVSLLVILTFSICFNVILSFYNQVNNGCFLPILESNVL